MEIKKINNKNYISLETLLKLGFPKPNKGTPVLCVEYNLGLYSIPKNHIPMRIYEYKEGWEGVWTSPFASYIGKKNFSEDRIFIPFDNERFKLIEFDESVIPDIKEPK